MDSLEDFLLSEEFILSVLAALLATTIDVILLYFNVINNIMLVVFIPLLAAIFTYVFLKRGSIFGRSNRVTAENQPLLVVKQRKVVDGEPKIVYGDIHDVDIVDAEIVEE